jgi:hypothetical protein
MREWKLYKLGLIAVVIGALWTTAADEASAACAIWDNLTSWFRSDNPPSMTTYAPPYAPAACATPTTAMVSSCGSPCAQTCMYVPQTAYRTVYKTVPVTQYTAFNSCDPCTGCPTVTYKPAVSYVRTRQLIPYTTYRSVWSNSRTVTPACTTSACGSYSACDPCSTGSCGWVTSDSTSADCSSCQVSADSSVLQPEPAPVNSTPQTFAPTTAPTPATGSWQPGSTAGSNDRGLISTPTTPPTPQTIQQQKPAVNTPLNPIPEAENSRPSSSIKTNGFQRTPQLNGPNGNKTAAINHSRVVPVSYLKPIARPVEDSDGWRASR